MATHRTLVVDEFTSHFDRDTAACGRVNAFLSGGRRRRLSAMEADSGCAGAKAVRGTECFDDDDDSSSSAPLALVFVTCCRDIIGADLLAPDWMFDTDDATCRWFHHGDIVAPDCAVCTSSSRTGTGHDTPTLRVCGAMQSPRQWAHDILGATAVAATECEA